MKEKYKIIYGRSGYEIRNEKGEILVITATEKQAKKCLSEITSPPSTKEGE